MAARSASAGTILRRVQVGDLLRRVPLQLVQLYLPVRVDEFIDAHEAAPHPHNELIVHDFRQNFLGAKHVKAFAETRDR